MGDADEQVARLVVSVDIVCFRLQPAAASLALEVLLVRREHEPFAGCWALPGGVIRSQERLAEAAQRVITERTRIRPAYLEQLYTFDEPTRDPRSRSLAVAYLGLLPLADSAAQVGRGVADVAWWPILALAAEAPLAFDHRQIIAYGHERLRSKIEWTPLIFHLVPEPFTLPAIRRVVEAIQQQRYNDSNFRRQLMARFPGIEPIASLDRQSNRPAQLFRYTGPETIGGPPPT